MIPLNEKKSWNVNFGALLERIDLMTMLYWVETKAKKEKKRKEK